MGTTRAVNVVVVVVSVAVALAVLVWFLANRKHPERASDHRLDPSRRGADALYAGVDQPAGPDAEDDAAPARRPPD